MILPIKEPWDPKTVIELAKMNVISDDEARRLLSEYRMFHGMPPLSPEAASINVTNVTEWPLTFTGTISSSTISIPPMPKVDVAACVKEWLDRKETRGVKIIADAVATYPHDIAATGNMTFAIAAILIDKAIAEERESCAKVVERVADQAYDKSATEFSTAVTRQIRDRNT